ncbi:MAG: hypothetical protein JWN29_3633 [Acidimicrobiales bacterium]|nr:hypothetical protein [Acidimicrobiales bacterium]
MHCGLSEQVEKHKLGTVDLARRVTPMLAWVAGLGIVLLVMSALDHGALAAPDPTDPASWGDWLAARTAPEAAVAVLRLVVIGLSWYLLAVTAAAVVVRVGRARRLVSVADVVTLPFVRSLVQAGLGVGLAGASVAAVGSVTVHHAGPSAAPTAADVALVSSVSTADAVMQRLPAEGAPPVMQKVGPVEAPVEGRTWTVRPGDHLWSIAERVLAESRSRPPTDGEVVPYWEQLVAANRDRLADRDNPDLLFPGQALVVPAPPSAP